MAGRSDQAFPSEVAVNVELELEEETTRGYDLAPGEKDYKALLQVSGGPWH